MIHALSEYKVGGTNNSYCHHYEFDVFLKDDSYKPLDDALNTAIYALYALINAQHDVQTSWRSKQRQAAHHLSCATEIIAREVWEENHHTA